MSLIASIPDIENYPDAAFVMHERNERYFPLHQHSKGQLTYVEGGVAYLEIDTLTFLIPARHYFWIPAHKTHLLKVATSATIMRTIFFYSEDDTKHLFYQTTGVYPITELLVQMLKYTANWEGHILQTDDSFSFLKAMKDLLPNISTKFLPIALPIIKQQRLYGIATYLQENIAEQHSLNQLSSHFGMTPRTLSRLFATYAGLSFLQYLTLLRIARAFELLLTPGISVSEVAYQTGFQTLSAFSKLFRRFTGYRPIDFIQMNHKGIY